MSNFYICQPTPALTKHDTKRTATDCQSQSVTQYYLCKYFRYLPCNPSKWEADLRSGGLLYFTTQRTSIHTELADSMVNLGEPGGGQVSRDGNFACRIHPAAQIAIGEQQWVTVSLCVKCCRMVDSVPIWHTISIL